MRSYIFTQNEVRRLLEWLKTGEEDDTTRMLFTDIRRNLHKLGLQIDLLLLVMKKLQAEGRFRGRATLPRDLASRLRCVESELAQRRKGQSTSDGLKN